MFKLLNIFGLIILIIKFLSNSLNNFLTQQNQALQNQINILQNLQKICKIYWCKIACFNLKLNKEKRFKFKQILIKQQFFFKYFKKSLRN